MSNVRLSDDLRARLESHRKRFEKRAKPENHFRIVVAKYVDHDCCERHDKRLLNELAVDGIRTNYASGEQTVRGAGCGWGFDQLEMQEFAKLVGSSKAIEQFTMLANGAGAGLPLELRPEAPFHDFENTPQRDGYDNCGIWIEFVFHRLFSHGVSAAFLTESDWPKQGCRITTLLMNPFLASVHAIENLIAMLKAETTASDDAEQASQVEPSHKPVVTSISTKEYVVAIPGDTRESFEEAIRQCQQMGDTLNAQGKGIRAKHWYGQANLHRDSMKEKFGADSSVSDQRAGDGQEKPQQKLHVVADVEDNTITVGDQMHDVKPHQAQIVNALCGARDNGEWYVTGPTMTQDLPACRGKNIYREMKDLKKTIPELKALIISEGTKGYRLIK